MPPCLLVEHERQKSVYDDIHFRFPPLCENARNRKPSRKNGVRPIFFLDTVIPFKIQRASERDRVRESSSERASERASKESERERRKGGDK